MRICVIQASWHADIVEEIKRSYVAALSVEQEVYLTTVAVPGIFEIPLQAKLAAKRERPDIIVAAGLIVTGGAYRADLIAQATLNGLMMLQLTLDTPIVSALLSPLPTEEGDFDALMRRATIKGMECAAVSLSLLKLQSLSRKPPRRPR